MQPRWGTAAAATALPTWSAGSSATSFEISTCVEKYEQGDAETHPVTDELETRGSEQLDELGVELFVGVPRAAGHLCRGLEVEEHVYLARGVLPDAFVSESGRTKRKASQRRTCTLPLMHFTSFFCVRDLRHRSMTVWCSSVLTLMCFVQIPERKFMSVWSL